MTITTGQVAACGESIDEDYGEPTVALDTGDRCDFYDIEREARHSDLTTIDLAHDIGERDLTDPFGLERH